VFLLHFFFGFVANCFVFEIDLFAPLLVEIVTDYDLKLKGVVSLIVLTSFCFCFVGYFSACHWGKREWR